MSNRIRKPPSAKKGIALRQIEDGMPLLVRAGQDEVLLIRDGDTVHAVAAKCTHMGGPLSEGLLQDGELRCPWHHARFCVKTGEAVAAPALKSLQRYQTQVQGDRLFVGQMEPRPARPKPSPSRQRVVIVGAGAGGFACADTLVRSGFSGILTVVNADPEGSYDRTACSKDYLAGKMARDECYLVSDTSLKRGRSSASHRVTWLKGRLATVLDPHARVVMLDTGERIGFDHCVLATGAEPQAPAIAPWDPDRVHTLRTLSDADAIIRSAKRARSVAILGSSFIALEAAASLRQRHLQVHVVAPTAVPLQKQFGADVGAMVRRLHEDHGVRFHLERRLVSYRERTARLDDGSQFKADFMILGTGVTPRLQLARDAGLAMATSQDGGGVEVDGRLQTSVPGIYAVGDIASYPAASAASRIRVEHWVHAQRQGQFVARAILGHRGRFADVPFFWSAHYDQTLSYIGHVTKPLRPRLKGRIGSKRFALSLSDPAGGKALVTSQRDLDSLNTEASWSRARSPSPRR